MLDPSLVDDAELLVPASRRVGAGTEGLQELDDLAHAERLAQMRSGLLGSVHSWELVTAVDGPGTRMTVFLSGCPLRCQYCHNPDTWFMRRGQPISAEDLLRRIGRYRRIFKSTGGGITLSGGEPMMQPAFVGHILERAHQGGIHTALDTSGFLGRNCTDDMLDNLDLVLLDVKSGLPDTYKEVTNTPLQPTIDFGDRLSARGIEIWVRFVLVPGLTDAPQNIDAAARIIQRWDSVSRVEVLPFHQMGRGKWEALGVNYRLEHTVPPSVEATEAARDRFRAFGLTVR